VALASPIAAARSITIGHHGWFQLRGSRVVCLVESPLKSGGPLLAIGCGLSRVVNQSPVPHHPQAGSISAAIWDLAGAAGRVGSKPPLFTTLWLRSWSRPDGQLAPPGIASSAPIFVSPQDVVLLGGTDIVCRALGRRSAPTLRCGFNGGGGKLLAGTYAYSINDARVAFYSVASGGRLRQVFSAPEPG
jgi:hypothetical protein